MLSLFSDLSYGEIFEFCKTRMMKIEDIGDYKNRAVVLKNGKIYHLDPSSMVNIVENKNEIICT